jgi:ABC-2 type transport system ATP-binding protein
LRFFSRLYGLDGVAYQRAVSPVVERLGLVEDLDRPCGVLSSGKLARLAIANACLHDPELLLLDEPTRSVDLRGCEKVRGLLIDRAASGTTIVLSTHSVPEARDLASQVAVIEQGSIRIYGASDPWDTKVR